MGCFFAERKVVSLNIFKMFDKFNGCYVRSKFRKDLYLSDIAIAPFITKGWHCFKTVSNKNRYMPYIILHMNERHPNSVSGNDHIYWPPLHMQLVKCSGQLWMFQHCQNNYATRRLLPKFYECWKSKPRDSTCLVQFMFGNFDTHLCAKYLFSHISWHKHTQYICIYEYIHILSGHHKY